MLEFHGTNFICFAPIVRNWILIKNSTTIKIPNKYHLHAVSSRHTEEYYGRDDGSYARIINPQGQATTYRYEPGGRLASVTAPRGESESYTYDKNGNIISVTDVLGNQTTLCYDCLDRVVELVNPLGYSKKFAYDAVGNITQVTDEKGHLTQYKYSLLGDIIEVIDATGHSTTYDYDKSGRLTKFAQYRLIDETLAGIKVPEHQITTYQRDKNGTVVAVIGPIDNVVNFGYDETEESNL